MKTPVMKVKNLTVNFFPLEAKSAVSELTPMGFATLGSAVDIPPLSARWEGQGGVNSGLVHGINGGRDYYLIVPTGDDLGELKYGGYGEKIVGADCASDGMANTKALLNSEHSHPAAEACVKFTCDGHSDYYLPSRRELQIAEANVPELFSKGWHWSSSQRSAYNAFSMYFGDGAQSSGGKGNEFRVRPVRRLFI